MGIVLPTDLPVTHRTGPGSAARRLSSWRLIDTSDHVLFACDAGASTILSNYERRVATTVECSYDVQYSLHDASTAEWTGLRKCFHAIIYPQFSTQRRPSRSVSLYRGLATPVDSWWRSSDRVHLFSGSIE